MNAQAPPLKQNARVDLTKLGDGDLATLRARVEIEMLRRGLAFRVGDLGEIFAIEYFNRTPGLPTLAPAPPGAKNVDAISREGERYSVKTMLKAKKTGTIYPDQAVPERQLFEYLLVVRLTDEYTLRAIYRFNWELFTRVRSWDTRMNAWYLNGSSKKLRQGELIFEE